MPRTNFGAQNRAVLGRLQPLKLLADYRVLINGIQNCRMRLGCFNGRAAPAGRNRTFSRHALSLTERKEKLFDDLDFTFNNTKRSVNITDVPGSGYGFRNQWRLYENLSDSGLCSRDTRTVASLRATPMSLRLPRWSAMPLGGTRILCVRRRQRGANDQRRLVASS